MPKIKNVAVVKTYESDLDTITISSHWNREACINLQIGDVEITVVAADLERAIANCTNVGF